MSGGAGHICWCEPKEGYFVDAMVLHDTIIFIVTFVWFHTLDGYYYFKIIKIRVSDPKPLTGSVYLLHKHTHNVLAYSEWCWCYLCLVAWERVLISFVVWACRCTGHGDSLSAVEVKRGEECGGGSTGWFGFALCIFNSNTSINHSLHPVPFSFLEGSLC